MGQQRGNGGQPAAIAMVTAIAVMATATAAVAAIVTAMAALATTTAAVAAMATAIVAMGTATAAEVAMGTAMSATMVATITAVARSKTTAATAMVGDPDNNQLKGAAEETTALAMVMVAETATAMETVMVTVKILFSARVVRFLVSVCCFWRGSCNFSCWGIFLTKEKVVHTTLRITYVEKNDQKHPLHHIFGGECFSSLYQSKTIRQNKNVPYDAHLCPNIVK